MRVNNDLAAITSRFGLLPRPQNPIVPRLVNGFDMGMDGISPVNLIPAPAAASVPVSAPSQPSDEKVAPVESINYLPLR